MIRHEEHGDIDTIRFHGDYVTAGDATNCNGSGLSLQSAFPFGPRTTETVKLVVVGQSEEPVRITATD